MEQRLYTREEAEALLPTLTPLLIELRDAKRAHEAGEEQVAALLVKVGGNGHRVDHERIAALKAELDQIKARVRDLYGQVASTGVEVKDIEQGLIDFYAEREGRIVYLCWRLGETGIDFWHDLDAGFAGRQPL